MGQDSPEKQKHQDTRTHIHTHTHGDVEAENSHNPPSASWRHREVIAVVTESMCGCLRTREPRV